MAPQTSNTIDLILRVIAVVMGIASVALLGMEMITVENAVILLGIGIVATALERLTEK
jgi:hypothetical protein